MAETIQSFVAKLQAEGVETGRQAADKLRAEAQQQAEKILHDARQQAEKILTEAKASGENLLARTNTELELAARDVVLRLQEALERALQALLSLAIKKELTQEAFLSQTLHDLVLLYAKADIERKGSMRINVTPELQKELAGWALQEMTRKAQEAGMGIDLKGSLAEAGFEYNVSGATVDVTLDSVVQALSELVSPQLQEIIHKAAGNLRSSREDPPEQGLNAPAKDDT